LETAAGHSWLLRFVVGVIYYFGIQQGVEAESLFRFFNAVYLETHMGLSPNALRQVKGHLHQHIGAYDAAEAEHCQPMEGQGICVAQMKPFLSC
jgi:hypothetical protein